MDLVVYALCAVTSLACAALLLRGWLRGRAPLLLWSTLCFAGLAVNNVILFVDKVVAPNSDYSLARALSGTVAVALLLYGLIEESR
ncbi:MAG TPA: DUF5985 family protein [Gaiellaceae bacterium]|jgi:hypothetical protein|nr:DUF5985 family protein [Gaiellaceae bacterium]